MHRRRHLRPSLIGVPGLLLCLAWLGAAAHPAQAGPESAWEPAEHRDRPRTLAELRRTADEGDVEAQFRLGLVYERGDGDFPSETEAIRWFRLAAEQGHAEAQFNLAVRYDRGRGVPRHSGEAVRWYRRAAEQGHVDARLNLGVRYAQGRGVGQDYAAAARWFRLGALSGDPRAQFNLGLLHEKGWGVPTNAIHALAWYEASARKGHEPAAGARARLLSRLSRLQVAEAERLAGEWSRREARAISETCCPCQAVCSLAGGHD